MEDTERQEFLEKHKDELKNITIRDLLELKYGYPMTSVLILIMGLGWVFGLSIWVMSFILCLLGLFV